MESMEIHKLRPKFERKPDDFEEVLGLNYHNQLKTPILGSLRNLDTYKTNQHEYNI